MKKEPKVLIVHGFEGTPNGGWRPWLMGQLALEDVYACALPMPSPATPMKEEWIEEVRRASFSRMTLGASAPDESIFLVGHSLGVPAILQYLQALPEGVTIGGAVLVSGPFQHLQEEEYKATANFFEPAFDFEKIKKACKKFTVIHGDNDPVVPFTDAGKFGKVLSCEVISIPNGGHLNGSSGWRELPAAFTVLTNWSKAIS